MEDKQIVKKCAISIPNEGHTQSAAYDNHLQVAFHLGRLEERWKHEKRPIRYEFYYYTVGRFMTAMAREKLTDAALKENVDLMLMYDDDMLLPIDMVERMLFDLEENPQIDILAPLAFMRGEPHYPVIYTTTEGFDQKHHRSYFSNQVVKNYPRDQLVECDAVGFGAVLIKMEVVKKMAAPYFFSTTGSGEDIYFCMKARRESKARVFVDTRIKLGHITNPVIVDEDYYWEYSKKNKIEIPETPHKYVSKARDE